MDFKIYTSKYRYILKNTDLSFLKFILLEEAKALQIKKPWQPRADELVRKSCGAPWGSGVLDSAQLRVHRLHFTGVQDRMNWCAWGFPQLVTHPFSSLSVPGLVTLSSPLPQVSSNVRSSVLPAEALQSFTSSHCHPLPQRASLPGFCAGRNKKSLKDALD